MIKAHYALWARLYAQTGAAANEFAVIAVDQFCLDLGYAKSKSGGFKSERRREAILLWEVLTSLELAVEFIPCRSPNRRQRLRGPLWLRRFMAEEQCSFPDDLASFPENFSPDWREAGLVYSPGHWFSDSQWKTENSYVGRMSSGLMKLRTDKDQTAIRIGAYLGSLGRMGQYGRRKIKVASLLDRIGMSDNYPRNPLKLQERIEAALTKLQDPSVSLIAGWRYAHDRLDEEDVTRQSSGNGLTPLGPWRQRLLEIEWPTVLLEERKRLLYSISRARCKGRANQDHRETL